MKPSTPVSAAVESLAQARRSHVRRIAIGGVLAATIVVLGVLAFLDTRFEWSSPVRLALVAGALILLVAALVRQLRFVRSHDTMEAARTIETNYPEMGQKLRTALEVSRRAQPPGDTIEAAFNRSLVENTSKELSQKPWRRLVPGKQLWKRRGVLLGVVALLSVIAWKSADFRHALKRMTRPAQELTYTTVDWRSIPKSFDEAHPPRIEFEVKGRNARPELVFQQRDGSWKPLELTRKEDGRVWDAILPGATRDIHLKVTAGDSMNPERTIAYRPVPKLVESLATVSYPAYTGLAPETSPGGDIRAVEDSKATWKFVFNTPPVKVTWSVAGAEPALLAPGSAEFEASSIIKTGKSRGELAIFDESGERIDAWHFEIEGVPDKLPQVEIIEPKRDLELISTAEMPIRIRAKDDFGVAEIGLILDAGGERQWVLETVIDEKNKRQVSDLAAMMLDKYQLKITDNVRLHAYALDHKPRGGPRAVSKLVSIDIKQFQMRLINGLNDDGQGGPKIDPEAVTDALKKLDEIIGAQRGILSDVFQTKESFRGQANSGVKAKGTEYAGKQQALAQETAITAHEWLNSGEIPQEDVTLLDTASEQMKEAVPFLAMADLPKGFLTGDRALSTLLQLRKELIRMISKCPSPNPKPMDNPPVPLADLAKEARRIAAEEKDVGSQIAPDSEKASDIAATRRQQEVAFADTGELFAKLIDHPERTDGALMLMEEAEKTVAKADTELNTETAVNAVDELADAERQLLDFATFVESMDLQKLSDTLRKLAENADKDAEAQKKAAGTSPSAGSPEEKGKAAENSSKNTDLAGKILEELKKKAAPEPGDEESKSPAASALAELAKRTDPQGLAKDLGKLEELQKQGGGDEAKNLAGEAARRLDELAREYREAAAALDASRLAELNKAREMAEALKKELAKKESEGNSPGEGKKPGEQAGKGEKPGEKGEGELAAKGEKPGEKGEGEKAGKEGKGDDGKGELAGKGKEEGKGKGEGEKPGEGEGPGKSKPGGQGPALDRFADNLERLDDPSGLGKIAIPLHAAPFDRSTIPLVDAADQRLQELIELIPSESGIVSAKGKLPEQSRREIEDYFRDLSDDFGGEEWESKKQ